MPQKGLVVGFSDVVANVIEAFTRSRKQLIEDAAKAANVDKDQLYKEAGKFLEGNTFHPNVLENLPLLKDWREAHPEALKAITTESEKTLRDTLKLHDDVMGSLKAHKEKGNPIVLYTEMKENFLQYFMTSLKLDGVFDLVVTQSKNDKPTSWDSLPKDEQPLLQHTRIYRMDPKVRKPNPAAWDIICKEADIDPIHSVLIDSDKKSGGIVHPTKAVFIQIERPKLSEELKKVKTDLSNYPARAAESAQKFSIKEPDRVIAGGDIAKQLAAALTTAPKGIALGPSSYAAER